MYSVLNLQQYKEYSKITMCSTNVFFGMPDVFQRNFGMISPCKFLSRADYRTTDLNIKKKFNATRHWNACYNTDFINYMVQHY